MFIVFNPAAGRRRTQLLWRVLDVIAASGVKLEIAETRHPGHAAVLARGAAQSGRRLVVAAGGDGTIAEVASGLAGSDCRLGVIPLGTANVLARELALPFAPAAVAAALAFGRTRMVWPGLVHSGVSADMPGAACTPPRLFVQMIGAGFDAAVVHRLPLSLKRLMGRGAYVVQSLREIARYKFNRIQLSVDGHDHEVGSVIVSKGHLYGGGYMLAPGASPTKHGFSVALFDRAGPLSTLLYGAALPLNLMPHMPGVRLLRASEVIVRSDHIPAQADGDAAGSAPLRITEASHPITVVVG